MFEDVSKVLPFLEHDSPFTPIYFQEPKLEEHSFESVSFTFSQAEQTLVVGPSSIVHQPTPISILPPPSFIFVAGSSTTSNEGIVNQGENMETPAFLLNKYSPLNLPQPMNAMPQEYIKLLPRFTREDEITVGKHCRTSENLNVEHLEVVMRLFV